MVEVSERLKNQIQDNLNFSSERDLQWVNDFKLEARKRVLKDGLPDKNIEEWKFSEKIGLFIKDWTVSSNKTSNISSGLDVFTDQDLVFQNGTVLKNINEYLISEGVTVSFLSEIPDEDLNFFKKNIFLSDKFLEERISKTRDTRSQALTNLNTILANDNSVLTFKKNLKFNHPLKILYDFLKSDTLQLSNMRFTIVIEEGVTAEIIETFKGGNENTWSNSVTNVYLKEGAKLLLTRIHDKNSKSCNTSHLYADLKKDSKLSVFSIASSNEFFREEFRVNLSGKHSECSVDGVIMTDKNNFGEAFAKVVHQDLNTKSKQTWRTIAAEKSQTAVQGRIRVEPSADGTDASFSSKSLLLGNKSKANAKPELEILADEVMCSHGSTIGQLDSEALFYLRSRGIDPLEARNLLIRAFINELVDNTKISDEALDMIYTVFKKFNL